METEAERPEHLLERAVLPRRNLNRLLDLLGELSGQSFVSARHRDQIAELRSLVHDECDRRDQRQNSISPAETAAQRRRPAMQSPESPHTAPSSTMQQRMLIDELREQGPSTSPRSSKLLWRSPDCVGVTRPLLRTARKDTGGSSVMVPVSRLAAYSPLGRAVWCTEPVREDDVADAIRRNDLRPTPISPSSPEAKSPAAHAARIAHFVVNGLPSDPIEIDIGVPELGHTARQPIIDGMHRLAAAIFSGAASIECEISGSVAHARELFGVEI